MKRAMSVLSITLALCAGGSFPAQAQHNNLRWKGPETCLQCHTAQAQDMHASAHYQWEGASPYQFDGPVLQGKKRKAVNSYCINILGNWGGCGNCHVGLGKEPVATLTPTRADLANIDCLICHQEKFGDVELADQATGNVPTSRPLGDIADRETTTKLYPFKYKTAYQPATLTKRLVALNTRTYFSTGNVQQSVIDGLGLMGLPAGEPWGWVTTDTFQLITHEVRPKEQALTCNSCHGATATQMNLKSLGYTLKQDQSTLCVQCHDRKESQMDYRKIHDKHVKDKGFDCSRCHTFSRPERGLR